MIIMSDQYSRGVLKMVIAQICQMIGWHSINSTPLEFLVDLMQEYLLRMSKITHQYSEILGRTEANLDDLGLAFRHLHILIPELSAYVRNVDSVPCIVGIPRFPVSRENHLNFLKPGSQEVVTRSVHIHEHLPAMFPNTEPDSCIIEKDEGTTNVQMEDSGNGSGGLPSESMSSEETSPQSVFKRPGGICENPTLTKRAKIIEEGRPLREIHSVMMTTSGFLSPAREGKLPEPRTPHAARVDSPPPVSSYPMVPPELKTEKKPKKILKKGPEDRKLDKENKKKNRVKELFKPDNISEVKGKKLAANAKEPSKTKPSKASGSKGHSNNSPGFSGTPDPPQLSGHKDVAKTPKALQSRIKPDRLSEVTSVATVSQQKHEETVDKLPSEPDKQKLNIFKKISKPREDKNVDAPDPLRYHKDVVDSREHSQSLTTDENSDKRNQQRNDIEHKKDEKKTPRTPEVHIHMAAGETNDIQSPNQDVYIFDDMSPPGTPSTPKTPELSVPAIVIPPDQKKKKKDRNVRKKEQRSKSPKRSISPKKVKSVIDPPEPILVSERPKTPQAMETHESHREPNNPTTLPFPFFPAFPPAPGLIPHPIGHPMFPRFPLPLGRGIPHPAMPNLPMPPRFLPPNIRVDDSLVPKINPLSDKIISSMSNEIFEPDRVFEKFQKPVFDKVVKSIKLDKESSHQSIVPIGSQNNTIVSPVSLNNTAITISPVSRLPAKTEKLEKLEKNNKKSKDHKKEKKDKLKKKKEKKEKHKIKDKSKVKKGKLGKLKDKKDKKEKRKEKEKDDKSVDAVPKITLKLGPTSPRPPTPDNTAMKKITIKPLIKKPDEEKKRDPSPELVKISALVTRPPKQKITKLKADAAVKKSDGIVNDKENGKDTLLAPSINADQSSRQVWICPACGNQDDGSPMIGCDDCDAWYHWVCVGVQIPPADHEDWYCRICVAKQQELHHDKKKKKRKKKVKAMA